MDDYASLFGFLDVPYHEPVFWHDPILYIMPMMGGYILFLVNFAMLLQVVARDWHMVNVWTNVTFESQLGWVLFFGMVTFMSMGRLYLLEKRGLLPHGYT